MTATKHYTPDQQRVIDVNDGVFLVVAPPGSGKTQILVERSIRLLRESAGGSFRILALTFTTRAAEELRDRVAAGVATEWHRMTTCTFHAFALDVLRHYGERIGVSAHVTVFESEDDRIESLAQALSEEGYGLGRGRDEVQLLRDLLGEISQLKRALVPPEAAPEEEIQGIDLTVAYEAYRRKLRQLSAVDFDDILALAVSLFSEHPRVARHYRRMYRYVLVDEAQDTSRAQYELLRALLGDEHRNVLMVADADQAIFRFAGSDSKFLRRFEEEFSANRLSLSSNFRCARKIVEGARRLIEHNPETRRPVMSSAGDAEGELRTVETRDEAQEAAAVKQGVESLLTDGFESEWLASGESTQARPEEICVLGRTRYALTTSREALEDAGIEVQFGSGGTELFDTTVYRGLHLALRVASNPRDLLSREKLAAQVAASTGTKLSGWRDSPASVLLGRLAADAGVEIATSSAGSTVDADFDLEPLLRPFIEFSAPSEVDAEARERLVRDAQTLSDRWSAFNRSAGDEDRGVGSFLHHLSLAGRAALTEPGVRVLTIHAVKGLEFRAVFLVGMNEGTFPDFRALDDDRAIQDERRNAYVAITRASRFLQLSRPRLRQMPWGDSRVQTASRFLREIHGA